MKVAICGLLGVIVGASLGYFIGGMGGGVGKISFTVHLAITFGFMGVWSAVIFDKIATEHEESHGPLRKNSE